MASTYINVEMLIVLVQERPEIWDPRDANYANRTRKEASWRRICRQMYHDCGDRPRDEQHKILEDVMKRWRSIRDQYRRERQQRSRSGDAGYVKRKYIYYDRLSFLAPILDLRLTQSNLTDRGTASEAEPIIDPVGDEVAGPSSPPTRRMAEDEASQDNTMAGLHTTPPGRSAAAPSPILEEPGNLSSSSTAQIRPSPQAALTSRRTRRRRQVTIQESRTNVDTGVLNYLSRVATDDGEEACARSLTLYLRALTREVQLHIRGCIQILLDASTPPNTPYEVFEFLERWQLSPRNLMCMRPSTQMLAQAGSEQPLIRGPTPQPLPPPTQPSIPQPQMSASSQPHQYGHLYPPSFGGWSQPGWGRSGYLGGYEPSAYHSQQEAPHHHHYFGQYPQQSQEAGQFQHHVQQYGPTQGDVGHSVQQHPQAVLPRSPSPTYEDL
ncbi:uncharacterized protein [Dendrobates tinctorius]|uniref:uncharacterized protein n=1 Tax=Dendrobates tinctorius TaxID=92724 RepID=UPI003CCA40F4